MGIKKLTRYIETENTGKFAVRRYIRDVDTIIVDNFALLINAYSSSPGISIVTSFIYNTCDFILERNFFQNFCKLFTKHVEFKDCSEVGSILMLLMVETTRHSWNIFKISSPT